MRWLWLSVPVAAGLVAAVILAPSTSSLAPDPTPAPIVDKKSGGPVWDLLHQLSPHGYRLDFVLVEDLGKIGILHDTHALAGVDLSWSPRFTQILPGIGCKDPAHRLSGVLNGQILRSIEGCDPGDLDLAPLAPLITPATLHREEVAAPWLEERLGRIAETSGVVFTLRPAPLDERWSLTIATPWIWSPILADNLPTPPEWAIRGLRSGARSFAAPNVAGDGGCFRPVVKRDGLPIALPCGDLSLRRTEITFYCEAPEDCTDTVPDRLDYSSFRDRTALDVALRAASPLPDSDATAAAPDLAALRDPRTAIGAVGPVMQAVEWAVLKVDATSPDHPD